MVRIIPEKKIKYEEHKISEKSIGSVLKDLEQIENKIKKAGHRYFSDKKAEQFQTDIAKIRVNLIGAIKP